ncbi:MAG: GlsB/YeaQ/YmgE family stress response membrane protein [Verrucomicrobia bacterium]|nr:GlsB/YeaQ/YmgE family stress response membrane protein [Verrucomicrobiota bacterium]
MTLQTFLSLSIIGLLAGGIASLICKRRGAGLLVNLAVGLAGAFAGNFVLHQISPVLSQLLFAAAGAVLLLWLLSLLKK